MLKRKKCSSDHYVKYGRMKGHQWYKCTDCGCQFTDTKPRGVDPVLKNLAVVLYDHCGVSILGIAKLFNVRAVEYGTGKRLKDISEKRGVRFHAKTGTTNECKDGWCIGFTQGLKRNLVIGVFVGYPIPQSLGENATGARTALPLVKNILENIPNEYLAKA